jgi:hypothetical protein
LVYPVRDDTVAGILSHKKYRIDRNLVRHSYIADIGSRIGIQLLAVYPLFENHLLDPPLPETRFFEIEIDEVQKDGGKMYAFQTIVPVTISRKPGWNTLNVKNNRDIWIVTERIHMQIPDGEIQWLYSDDFNILSLTWGNGNDPGLLMHQITGKLDAIAQSIWSGTRVPSEFEMQLAYRDAFNTLFSGGVDRAFCNTVLYQQHSQPSSLSTSGPGSNPAGKDFFTLPHQETGAFLQDAGNYWVNLDPIEELRDLSWLTD